MSPSPLISEEPHGVRNPDRPLRVFPLPEQAHLGHAEAGRWHRVAGSRLRPLSHKNLASQRRLRMGRRPQEINGAPSMRAIACETCTFWVGTECHRHAPVHADRSCVNPNQPENGRIPEYTTEWPQTAATMLTTGKLEERFLRDRILQRVRPLRCGVASPLGRRWCDSAWRGGRAQHHGGFA
jgi:hypothetical protein